MMAFWTKFLFGHYADASAFAWCTEATHGMKRSVYKSYIKTYKELLQFNDSKKHLL